MPVQTRPENNFCKFHFVFRNKSILISEEKKLPSDEILKKIIASGSAEDWFSETDKNYTAVMLKEEAALPQNFTFIPLRQFFWETKDKTLETPFVPSEEANLSSRAHSLLCQRKLYRLCPSCGTELTDDKTFTARKCPSCGQLFFPRIEPAVIVLVNRQDEILLVKNKLRNEFWSCVAGFVEQGESIEQTVEREVLEETGITIKNVVYRGSQSWPFPDQLMLAFTAEYKSGEIKIQEDELEDASWFKRDNLPVLPKPGSVAYNLIHGIKCSSQNI